ncbi:hypothetical protein Hanom_Chr05g00409631 [Helianthus anomalus]
MNFLTDPHEGRSTLRPSDVLVFGWAGEKHTCVNHTGVSSVVGPRDNRFVAGQAMLMAELGKVAKREQSCAENQNAFILFSFNTFESLATEVVGIMKRVQRVMHNNFSMSKNQSFVFSRIGFAI